MKSLLDNGPPFEIMNCQGSSPILLICEHASRHIPAHLNGLGLDAAAQSSHIAWDIGAGALAKSLAEEIDATLISQTYSRLLYDCNRPPDAASAIPLQSELTPIPGNRNLSAASRQQRIDEIYHPFHDQIDKLIEKRLAAKRATIVVAVHSFTGTFKGQRRALDLGILHDSDRRLADLLLAQAENERDYMTKRNEPYAPADGVTHMVQRQAMSRGLLNVMLEVRNELIEEDKGQKIWTGRLTKLLSDCLKDISLGQVTEV